jgi:guanine deaminase
MIVQGLLLIDPARPPEVGYLRIDGGRIGDIGFGGLPRNSGPPDVGSPTHVICPAFIDAHFHFPQIDSVGCDGMPLLEWLDRVIFPAEAWWGRGAAIPSTRTAIRRLVSEGTVGVAGYLTSHAQGSAEALAMLSRTPMRFHVGRVAMDRAAPDELTKEDRERAARRPIPSPILTGLGAAFVVSSGAGLPRQNVSANPRFAISCSPELLAEVGWAAGERNEKVGATYVQTHLSESVEECARVRELFGEAHYTHVYDKFGLLTDRTILAHCVHLADAEWELIARKKCIVASCPGANIFLKAGLFNLDKAREFAVRLTLGTDVAAGPDVAMPRVARAFIETAKVRAIAAGAKHIPTPAEAWNLITRVNADALGWPDAGRIEKGAAADLLVLRVPDLWRDEHLVGRLIYNWSADLIEARVFDGQAVDPATISSA